MEEILLRHIHARFWAFVDLCVDRPTVSKIMLKLDCFFPSEKAEISDLNTLVYRLLQRRPRTTYNELWSVCKDVNPVVATTMNNLDPKSYLMPR